MSSAAVFMQKHNYELSSSVHVLYIQYNTIECNTAVKMKVLSQLTAIRMNVNKNVK